MVHNSCATNVNSLSFTYLSRISSTIPLAVTFEWKNDSFLFIFLAYLVDNLLLFSGHCTFPLSSLLAFWRIPFPMPFCAQYLLLAPLDKLAPVLL